MVISHETIYRNVFGDKAAGGNLYQQLRCQKKCKKRYAVLAKVKNKTSDLVSSAIITKLNAVTPLAKTLTFDKGKEFTEHARFDRALQSTTYFADSFASWQRESNENFNDLLRQYIPKKRPLSNVTDRELMMVQAELNSRPRKRLGFKIPNEVFMQSLRCCTSCLNLWNCLAEKNVIPMKCRYYL